jgi:O-antigen ligase
MLVGRRVRPYLGGALMLMTAAAAIHIVFCLTHRVGQVWGRYLYFADAQPNLGGEVNGAAALAAAYVLRRPLALGVLALFLIDTALLQSRSAILVEMMAALVVILHDPQQRTSIRRTLVMGLAAIVATVGVLVLDTSGRVFGVFNSLLLINDQYRGVDSGASGRVDLWQTSIDLFVQSPLYGHALGYFNTIGYIGAHNLVLLALAQFGVLSGLFFFALIYAYRRILRVDPFRFWVLIAALPLFAFNDRLLNLNPYPFLIYVMLLLPSPLPAPAAGPAQIARPTARPVRRSGARRGPISQPAGGR